MKNSNPFNIYKDVIGAKVFYKGCPVYFEDYISNYEGDFWKIRIEENRESSSLYIPDFTDEGANLTKQIEKIRKEKELNRQ